MDKEKQNRIKTHIGNVFTGGVIGFLAASVLYSKQMFEWVPNILANNPSVFFSCFVIVCGALGYVWSIVD